MLCTNPKAIHLIEANPHRIDWFNLSSNPTAIHILKENQDKIHWEIFSYNQAIYEYDYKNMTRPFTEELMQNRFHPNNVSKFEAWGF
jgi:hypothetical protein